MQSNHKYGGIYLSSNGTYFVKTKTTTKDGYIVNVNKRGFFNKTDALNYKNLEIERIKNIYRFEQNNQNMFFYDFLDLFLEEYALSCSKSTVLTLKGFIRNYYKKYLPNKMLSSLKPFFFSDFRHLIAKMDILNAENKNKRIAYLKRILQSAVDKLYLDAKLGSLCINELKPIASDGHIKNNDFWELKEFQAFISTFDDSDKYKLLFRCLFSFGCRISEFRALQWNDLDPIRNTIHIHQQVTSKLGNGSWVLIPHTKTKKDRHAYISAQITKELLAFKEKNHYQDNDFIFFGKKPVSDNAIVFQKKKHCEMAGVKYIRNHDFRHSNITLLLDSGVDLKAVASNVGHSSVATTLDVYNHMTDKRKDKLKDVLNDLGI